MRKFVLLLGISFLIVFFPACKGKEKAPQVQFVGVGSPAPQFQIQDISGKTYTPSTLKGKVVLLEFFATWCPPCRAAIPDMDRLFKKFKGKEDFVLLAIATDEDSDIWPMLKKFTKENKIFYPVAPDLNRISDAYNVDGIPSSFVIDRNGIISFHHIGFTPDTYETLVTEIEVLLNKHA